MLPSAGVARPDQAVGLSASQFFVRAYQTKREIGPWLLGLRESHTLLTGESWE
jgi:hypothetical protein